MDVFKALDDFLMRPPALTSQRLPTFYPSASSCSNKESGGAIGSCLRSQYYRCAGYSKTNPPGLFSQYIFSAGNLWEDKLIEYFKEMGIWRANSVKFQDIERYISGEVDIVIYDPDIDKNVIVECKTYSSANYKAKKEICGNKSTKPKPKDQNLLQSFLYLGYFEEQGVDRTYLIYFDRACGGPENNKQFCIMVHEENGEKYPKISCTDADGSYYEYIDRRITLSGIYERYQSLMDHLKESKIPEPDYRIALSPDEVKKDFEEGLIAKTTFAKWERDNSIPIRDWSCTYCDYRDLCQAQQSEAEEE